MDALKHFYELLCQPNLDSTQFALVDSLKIDFCRKVTEVFIQYPTLESLHFKFEEILRISEVWEGSDEELFTMGTVWWNHPDILKKQFGKDIDYHISNFMSAHKQDNILPVFKDLKCALYSESYTADSNIFSHPEITLVNLHDYYNRVSENFWYLSEEPSHIKEILKAHKQVGTNWDFIREIDNPQSTNELIGQLSLFLGKALAAYISYHSLQQNTEIQHIKVVRHKI